MKRELTARLVVYSGAFYPDRWYWTLESRGLFEVCSLKDGGYTSERGARDAAKRWAEGLGLTIVDGAEDE